MLSLSIHDPVGKRATFRQAQGDPHILLYYTDFDSSYLTNKGNI